MREYYKNLLFNLRMKEWMIKEGKYDGVNKEWIDDLIIKSKRKIRKALKQREMTKYLYPGRDGNGYGEIVNGKWDFDTGWKKVFFPSEHWSDREIEEFREENWKHIRYSAYDCTNDVYTDGIDVFNVPNGVVAYIRESVDC